jgi:hypothetical protein
MKCFQVVFIKNNGEAGLADINVFHLHEKIYSVHAFIKYRLDKMFGEIKDFDVLKQYEV